jgi:hypothetical protein
VIQTVVQLLLPVNHLNHLHQAPHPVLLGHQALHLVHHPQVLFAHILDTKEGPEVAKAVRQVKVIKVHLANRKVKVRQANQRTEVHQDKKVEIHHKIQDGIVHQDMPDEVVHQDIQEVNTRATQHNTINQILHHNQNIVQIDGTKGLNKLKLYARH